MNDDNYDKLEELAKEASAVVCRSGEIGAGTTPAQAYRQGYVDGLMSLQIEAEELSRTVAQLIRDGVTPERIEDLIKTRFGL